MKKKLMIAALCLLCAAALAAGILLARGDFEEMSGLRQVAWAVLNRTELENTEFVGTLSADTWQETDAYLPEDTVRLQKDPNKDFVIMNLTDLHMTDFDYYGSYNIRLFSHIRALAERVQPDLITITGDIFCTKSVALSVHQFTEFMDSLGIPWAPMFGNHDADGNCDANYMADVMMESEFCLMQKGDPGMGIGNYIVNICEDEKIIHSLIFVDTHGDGIWENQIGWYQWAASGANAPSTVLLHIPLHQYQQAYDAAWDGSGWKDGFDAFGEQNEAICPEPGEDTGFFDTVKAVGLTKNIICGHDHINNFSLVYQGVRLTYSMRLGLYGQHSPEAMGATVLTVDNLGNVEVDHVHRYE